MNEILRSRLSIMASDLAAESRKADENADWFAAQVTELKTKNEALELKIAGLEAWKESMHACVCPRACASNELGHGLPTRT